MGGLLKILLNQTKEESQRAAHHSIPAFRVEMGRTVENTLKTKHKEESQKSSTSLNPCIGGNG
jgi:hypothetical protein